MPQADKAKVSMKLDNKTRENLLTSSLLSHSNILPRNIKYILT
jgi:hypothetical protein